MQQQPNVLELRAASDEAVAAAQAGLGPLFASHLQTQLLERPQDFVNDQVPLVSAAGRARLALLEAEDAETDAATTPAALKRLLESKVSDVLFAQEQFEARVGEKLDELRTRVEKGEEKVHELVTVKGAELRDELTRLAAQQHEKSATELVEKMGAFRGEFQVAMLQMEAKLTELNTKWKQLELVCPGGRVEVDPMALLGKLGLSTGSLPAARDDLARKTALDFSGKGLEVDDGRALAGLLASYGNTVDFKELNVSNNRIGNVGLSALAETIETGAFDGLHSLKLANTRIGYKGMQALTKAMRSYGTLRLTEINFDGNVLLSTGGMSFAELLRDHQEMFGPLEIISLNGCQIGDAAASVVLEAIPRKVKKLGLAGNLLGNEFSPPTMQSLEIESLEIGDNPSLQLTGPKSVGPITVLKTRRLDYAAETLEEAFEASSATSHNICVIGCKIPNRTDYQNGANPYASKMSLNTVVKHMAGRPLTLLHIGEKQKTALQGSIQNGVKTEPHNGYHNGEKPESHQLHLL